ncbi:MAG: hypothetical protein K6A91_02135 [Clostridia bacterium]|nr:hypothetical protein [Clostridia bacterium]
MIKKILYTALVLIVLVAAAVIIHGRAGREPQPVPANNAVPVAADVNADDSDPLPDDLLIKKDGILIGPELTVGEAPDGYYSDALFVGDSRFVGLQTYGKIDGALWFCSTGLGINNYNSKGVDVRGYGDINLETLLKKKSFGKIYIGMGINDLGYNMDKLKSKFADLFETIRKLNPDAMLILVSNLHVGYSRSSTDKWVNNSRINELNSYFESLQDGHTVFYLECNGLFDNANGDMDSTYTHDSTHILGKYYTVWGDYIKAHAITGK